MPTSGGLWDPRHGFVRVFCALAHRCGHDMWLESGFGPQKTSIQGVMDQLEAVHMQPNRLGWEPRRS